MENLLSSDSHLLAEAFKGFLSSSDEYAFVKDKNFVYHAASEAFAKLCEQDGIANILGKTDYDLFPSDIADIIRSDDEKLLATGKALSGYTEKLLTKNGTVRWSKTWKQLVKNQQGEVIGLYGRGRDVTAEVEMQTELASSRHFKKLVNSMLDGVSILHEQDGGFLLDFFNEAWCKVHYFSKSYAQSLLHSNVQDFVYPADVEALKQEFWQVDSGTKPEGHYVYRVYGEDKKLHWLDIRYRMAYEENGIKYYYASHINLDAQKEAEAKLADSQLALREAISHSDIQFFTYFPDKNRCEIYAVSERLSELPMVWEAFPDDFLSYTKASPEDRAAYKRMLQQVLDGADYGECTVRFLYKDTWGWEHMRLNAVRDENGKLIKAQGYSENVTQKKLEEHQLQEKLLKLRSLTGNTFETFTFNLTKKTNPDIQTRDWKLLEISVPEELKREAFVICPPLKESNPATVDVLLRAAARIPDAAERAQFIVTCSSDAVRQAYSQGHYKGEVCYRRYIGDTLRWVISTSEVLPDPATGDLVALYYTADVTDRVVREKMFNAIAVKHFETVGYYDLQTDKLYVNATHDAVDATFTEGVSYQEAIEIVAQNCSTKEEATTYLANMAPEMLKAKLASSPLYTCYYTRKDKCLTLPGQPLRQMRDDIFYLDEHKDVIVFLLSDITEVVERESEQREKLASALLAAQQASVAKSEFLSRMSHEIRTPMNAIIGLDAIALQEKNLTKAMEDYLQKIGLSARFLLSLINDILDMSRIESGRMLLKKAPFNFEDMINSINTILYEQCRVNGLDYDCVLKSYTEPFYIGDVMKLQQVLINLLGNSVKFTPKGGKVHFMIEQIASAKDKAVLRFEVADTGIGIDERFIPHLFEAFTQEERGTTSVYGGTGLGLAISKNIINLMGGTISVHSIKNVGSEFTVEVELGLTKETVRKQTLLPPKQQSLYTLIVDDDVIVCRHTQLVLKDAGYEAEWVESGAGALTKVTKQHELYKDYDVILLDWKMPDMDGIETARRIRKIVGPEVTIIIMTAYDWANIEQKALEAGVNLFMKKPLFVNSLNQAFANINLQKPQETTTVPEFDFTGKRVLLAEDNVINAEIAKKLLEHRHCSVEVVSNGAEAVESFAENPNGYYDAILMDVRMPIMDGLSATKAIRAMRREDSKTVPILAMTANAFAEDVNISLQSGMNAHLTKPIEPAVFYSTLYKYFKK